MSIVNQRLKAILSRFQQIRHKVVAEDVAGDETIVEPVMIWRVLEETTHDGSKFLTLTAEGIGDIDVSDFLFVWKITLSADGETTWLCERQNKFIITTPALGFSKFSMPLVRKRYPQLILPKKSF